MRNLLLLAVVPLLATACMDLGFDWTGPELRDQRWEDDDSWDQVSNVETSRARLDGQIGEVRFSDADEAWVNVAMAESDYAMLDIRNDGPGGTGMAMLNLWVDLQDLQPGDVLHGGMDPDSWDSEPMMVDLIGCSGDVEDEWDYDEPAEDVEVVVEDDEDDGSVLLSWTGSFPNGEVSSGQIRIELPRTQ